MLTGAVWEKYFTSRKDIMEIGGEESRVPGQIASIHLNLKTQTQTFSLCVIAG